LFVFKAQYARAIGFTKIDIALIFAAVAIGNRAFTSSNAFGKFTSVDVAGYFIAPLAVE
jgi:hypothetical protein